jgi:uncharacterized membrane protein
MQRAEHHWTRLALTSGTLLAGGCLLLGFALRLLGGDPTAGDPRQLELVLRAAVELRPWGWSMVGVLLLIATPAAGLVASFFELRAGQPRVALLALAVLGVLGLAVAVALR